MHFVQIVLLRKWQICGAWMACWESRCLRNATSAGTPYNLQDRGLARRRLFWLVTFALHVLLGICSTLQLSSIPPVSCPLFPYEGLC